MVESETTATKQTCHIMHAYRLEDYDVEPWLSELWATKLNREFKQKLNQVPVIERIKAQLETQYAE